MLHGVLRPWGVDDSEPAARMSLILLLLTVAPPTCTPDITGTTWNNGKTTWQCNGSTWVSYTADAGGVPVLQAGPFSVSCTNCSGGGGSSSALTVDGGRLGAVDWIDGGWINATVSNFPAMWPQLQWVGIDGGTTAAITNFPANLLTDGGVVNVGNFPAAPAQWQVIDGGYVNVLALPAVVLDGGVNISSLPAIVIDGGVNVSNFPAQALEPNGTAHNYLLVDTTGAQYTNSIIVKPLPLPKCNPVRRYNCQ